MSLDSPREPAARASELWSCVCYVCGADALWEISVSGEDECVEDVFACELHARGHMHRAIVLPEQTSTRSPYVAKR
jgi:hypothetical protein